MAFFGMFCRKRPCFCLLCTMKAVPGMARPDRFYPPQLPAPTTPGALRYRASGEGNHPPPGSPPGKCLSGHPFHNSTAHRIRVDVRRHAARQGFPPTPLRAAGPRLDGPRAVRLVKGADGRLRRGRETRLVRQTPSKKRTALAKPQKKTVSVVILSGLFHKHIPQNFRPCLRHEKQLSLIHI